MVLVVCLFISSLLCCCHRAPAPPRAVSTYHSPPPPAGINRNRYIALMSAITLRENPGETIVTDSCTSNGLATFITQLGGKHFRFKKVGERAGRYQRGCPGQDADGTSNAELHARLLVRIVYSSPPSCLLSDWLLCWGARLRLPAYACRSSRSHRCNLSIC